MLYHRNNNNNDNNNNNSREQISSTHMFELISGHMIKHPGKVVSMVSGIRVNLYFITN